jgi:hypothetical protein
MRSTFSARWALSALLLSCALAHAQNGAWQDLGPGPSTGGQVEGIVNGEVVGAVNALAPHPTNADILYVGAVNGGIWRTNNATAASPAWVRTTDSLISQSILSLELDPTDASAQTLLAGIGRNSSLSSIGGSASGLLRTTNGGTNWTVLAGTGVSVAGREVRGVAARGAVLVAATNSGLLRSTDTGATYVLISGLAGSGLPTGNNTDLAADPLTPDRLYAPVVDGAARGIYRSDNRGETWAKVSDAAVDTPMAAAVTRARLSVGRAGQVFLVLVTSGRVSHVFRSADGASAWETLGIPTTAEQNGVVFGANAGGQGGTHLSISADALNSNVVYIGGDRQPYFGEGVSGSSQFFPNSIGANDYSGRLFRGELGAATVWRPLTHSGTSNNSAPHADSRDMALDAAGNILETDDGGVYKRLQPDSAAGSWLSLNGSLQSTEYHSLSYDAVSDRVVGGAQDTGTTEQTNAITKVFRSVSTGDGGDTAVNDIGSTTQSVRYTSFQGLQQLRRRTVDVNNVVISTAFPARTPLSGSPAPTGQFYSPIATNAAGGPRLIIGGGNGVYESLDQGDTVTQISTQVINQIRGSPLVYGTTGNPDFLYFGSVNSLYLRTTSGGTISSLAALPISASIVDVAIDPATARGLGATTLFALTGANVFISSNTGVAFSSVTGNLITGFSPGTLRSMAFIPGADSALAVSTDRGVYLSRQSTGYSVWAKFGSGLPNVPGFQLEYDVTDNVLVLGTLGRGAWKLSNPLSNEILFANGFE